MDYNIFLKSLNLHESTLKEFKETAFPIIEMIVENILRCFKQNGKILLIGNGGSSADCQHIAGEFIGRYRNERIPLPAISLVTDNSIITCIGNDYDFKSIFSRQIQALGNEYDILWAFSTSGSSVNIIEAVKTAKNKNITIISFTGKANNQLEKISDICLCSNTEFTNHAQEIHQLSYHIICEYLDKEFS